MCIKINNIEGKIRLSFLIAAVVLILSVIFADPKSMSIVYFFFGIAAIFSAVIYLQIHFLWPERKAPELKKYPSLTVIIPNRNYAKLLERSLDAIFNMDYPRKFDIIIIDDASTDYSVEIIEKMIKKHKGKKITFIKNKVNIGKAKNLNQAIRMTDSEIVACIDSDTYPSKNTLLRMVPHFYMADNVGAVTGFITVANPKNLIQKAQELEYYSAFGFTPKMMANINGLMVAPGPMTLFRRKILIGVGGYDENNLTEDMEIGMKLQRNHYVIEYCHNAMIPTEVPDTLKSLFNQRIRWYRGTIFNLNKYRDMLLNTDYKHFGMFSYPTCVSYVFFIILTFSIFMWHFAKELIFKGEILISGLSISSLDYLNYVASGPPIVFTSAFIVFFFMFMGLWTYYLYKSIKQANVNLNISHLPAALAILFLYPFMVSVFYIISFIKEVYGSGKTW
jgi:cellulose synthase/poly-beta-1,6-N-acetylglucosamine synthase-like glycosyltransferase